MFKPDFSNEITKFATIDQARERYKLSRTTIMSIATDADAVRRIGRSIRIDVPLMDAAVDKCR